MANETPDSPAVDEEFLAAVREGVKLNLLVAHEAAPHTFGAINPAQLLSNADAFLDKYLPSIIGIIPPNISVWIQLAAKAIDAANAQVNPATS